MSRTAIRSLMVVLVLGLTVPGAPVAVHAAAAKIRVVFVGLNGNTADIYAGDTDGTGLVNLTHDSNVDLNPSVSHDGTKILWTSYRGGNWDIYQMNADGSSQTQLTTDGAPQDWPRFSPDGTKIAYQSSQSGNDDIWVMNADGTGQTNLTNNSAGDLHPAWSPGGTMIAFDTNRDGNREVYTMNADGSGQTNVTTSTYTEEFPSFTADGTHLAYDSNQPPPAATAAVSRPSGSGRPDPGQCFEDPTSDARLWITNLTTRFDVVEWPNASKCAEEPFVSHGIPDEQNVFLGTPGFNNLPPVPQGHGFGGNVDVGGNGPAASSNTQLQMSWSSGMIQYVGYEYRSRSSVDRQSASTSITHCPVRGRTATCQVGTLAPGQRLKLPIRFKAHQLPAGVNRATVTITFRVKSSTPDPQKSNNIRKVRVTIVRH